MCCSLIEERFNTKYISRHPVTVFTSSEGKGTWISYCVILSFCPRRRVKLPEYKTKVTHLRSMDSCTMGIASFTYRDRRKTDRPECGDLYFAPTPPLPRFFWFRSWVTRWKVEFFLISKCTLLSPQQCKKGRTHSVFETQKRHDRKSKTGVPLTPNRTFECVRQKKNFKKVDSSYFEQFAEHCSIIDSSLVLRVGSQFLQTVYRESVFLHREHGDQVGWVRGYYCDGEYPIAWHENTWWRLDWWLWPTCGEEG